MSEAKKNILVTGGAGFIGSNLVKALLSDDRTSKIRVLDNFATGFLKNIKPFESHPKFEFIEGDIRNYDVCRAAVKDIDLISHQAALGSVPRSIKDPLTTHAVNLSGTLHIFNAAIENNIKRVVFASSSSVYGDNPQLPKIEQNIGLPLSPYAATKYMTEVYASVFARNFPFEYIGLRYFNIYGSNSRDFTYVDNAVEANILALFTDRTEAVNQVFNIACAERTTLTELWQNIKTISGCSTDASYGPNRPGDIPHSLASIEKAQILLGYTGKIKLNEGLTKAFEFYKHQLNQ